MTSAMRRTSNDILVVGLLLGLLPALWLLLMPARRFIAAGFTRVTDTLAGLPWPTLGLIALAGLAGLGLAAGLRVIWRRGRLLSYTRQSAASFHAATDATTREANAQVIRQLAAQGYVIPGFTAMMATERAATAGTPDRAITLLLFLRGCGDAGATAAQITESSGIRPLRRTWLLAQFQRQGLIARAARTHCYHITTRGLAHIADR